MRTLQLLLLAITVTLLSRLLPRQGPRFWCSLLGRCDASATTTASCRAAALPTPSREELEALGRPLPHYMIHAEGGDEGRALVRWMKTLKWRCEIGDESMLARPHPNLERISPHFPQFLHLPDRAGRLTYWELVGKLDERAMRKHGLKPDDLFQHYIWSTLFTWDVAAGDDSQEVTVIADFADFRISVLTPTVLKVFMRVAKVLRSHFPSREHGIFVINAPPWIETAYKMVRPLISEAQREKVRVIHGREQSEAALRELIHPSNLPPDYGGTGPPLGTSPWELRKREMAKHR
mmetsp:Transcript_46258/g.148525  ORF Transcript_46258/g.148525 Transcript_46258/m.148525 type:complete len:292 (-) Transcript_46258:45-920(-)